MTHKKIELYRINMSGFIQLCNEETVGWQSWFTEHMRGKVFTAIAKRIQHQIPELRNLPVNVPHSIATSGGQLSCQTGPPTKNLHIEILFPSVQALRTENHQVQCNLAPGELNNPWSDVTLMLPYDTGRMDCSAFLLYFSTFCIIFLSNLLTIILHISKKRKKPL